LDEEKTIQPIGRRKRIAFVLVACLLVGIGAIAFWPGPKEPVYDGKMLSEWLDICRNYRRSGYLPSPSAEYAQHAVRKIGTNGLPLLVKWTDYDMPKWKSDLLASRHSRWLPKPIRVLMVRPLLQAQWAQEGFDVLGTIASPATPALVRISERWPAPCPFFAVHALKGLEAQPEELCALVGMATNRSKPVVPRQMAMGIIGTLHNVEKYESWVVPAILPCIDEGNMANSTIIALGSLKIPPDIGVPVMRKAARSGSAEVRVWAVVSLERYGKLASPAIPELLGALLDHDEGVHREAAEALKLVEPEVLPDAPKNL